MIANHVNFAQLECAPREVETAKSHQPLAERNAAALGVCVTAHLEQEQANKKHADIEAEFLFYFLLLALGDGSKHVSKGHVQAY